MMDPSRDVVMGHEFTARSSRSAPTSATAHARRRGGRMLPPVVMDAGGIHAVGYSNDYPGGYCQQTLSCRTC